MVVIRESSEYKQPRCAPGFRRDTHYTVAVGGARDRVRKRCPRESARSTSVRGREDDAVRKKPSARPGSDVASRCCETQAVQVVSSCAW